ncbi:hypothetical protein EDD11_003843 [Mortierella claussenii]|nr:hypothetical protein EDD11_003843 [Mortierella claussenii]
MSTKNDNHSGVESAPLAHTQDQPETSSNGREAGSVRGESSYAAGVLRVLPGRGSVDTRTIGEEFLDVKKNLQNMALSLERLGHSLEKTAQIAPADAPVESVRRAAIELPGTSKEREKGAGALEVRTRRAFRGRRPSKFFTPRKPNWTLKVFDPRGLQLSESTEKIEMKDATRKCLEVDGVTETGYIEKSILAQLISGEDAILQIRGNKLDCHSIYPIVDVLENATPELQVLILVNRLETQSTKNLMGSLQKHLEVADLHASVHTVPQDKKLDLELLAKRTLNEPCIYITTPEMMARLKHEGVIRPKAVHVLVVYEAEYVTRTPAHIKLIREALEECEVCQVILAAHEGTEDVLQAADAFKFPEETVVFSMDHINIRTADHYRFTEDALLEQLLDRVVQLSESNTVVVVCHDAGEVVKMKDLLAERTDVHTAAKGPDLDGSIHGVVITQQFHSTILHSRRHNAVKMILNLAGQVTTPSRYLDMLASYMDIGQACEVVTKVGNSESMKEFELLEKLGAVFEDASALMSP